MDTTGTTKREYFWLGDMPVAVLDVASGGGATIYDVHVDHLMRPILMTDQSQTWAWYASYKPFGEVASLTSNPAVMNGRFPGQWFQLETGLAYNWHRHYDPTLGRYIQADPMLSDGPSAYGYVGGSPLTKIDPSGKQAVGALACLAGPIPCAVGISASTFATIVVGAAIISQSTPSRQGDLTAGEERQYDRVCPKSGDPCSALKAALDQAIAAAKDKIGDMLKDKLGLYGTPGWANHADNLNGRIKAINDMISLGNKLGCDMTSETAAAADLNVPVEPRQ